MKSKQCSHNLQSNQEICLLIIPYITKDLWFWGKKKLKKEIEGQTLFLFIIVWLLSSVLILHVTVYHFSDISC